MEKVETRNLPVELTESEILVKSRELSKQTEAKEATEEEKKKTAKEFDTKIKILDGEIKHLARIVTTGVEHRPVRVRREMDFERFVVEFYRTDTGEMVESRPMNYDERQSVLFQKNQTESNDETEE